MTSRVFKTIEEKKNYEMGISLQYGVKCMKYIKEFEITRNLLYIIESLNLLNIYDIYL